MENHQIDPEILSWKNDVLKEVQENAIENDQLLPTAIILLKQNNTYVSGAVPMPFTNSAEKELHVNMLSQMCKNLNVVALIIALEAKMNKYSEKDSYQTPLKDPNSTDIIFTSFEMQNYKEHIVHEITSLEVPRELKEIEMETSSNLKGLFTNIIYKG